MVSPGKQIRELQELAYCAHQAYNGDLALSPKYRKEFEYRYKKMFPVGQDEPLIEFLHTDEVIVESEDYQLRKQLDKYIMCCKKQNNKCYVVDPDVAGMLIQKQQEVEELLLK